MLKIHKLLPPPYMYALYIVFVCVNVCEWKMSELFFYLIFIQRMYGWLRRVGKRQMVEKTDGPFQKNRANSLYRNKLTPS